jgi:spermidine synthase
MIGALYTLSGVAALVLEVVWMRAAGLALGADAVAVTAVLSGFMGGLALGALAGGRLVRRSTRPLYVYGAVELGVALCALGMPWLLQSLASLPAAGALVAAVVVVAVPAMLMGATYPAVCHAAGSRTRSIRLYALNTAGAVIGALGGAYVLLPTLGVIGTGRVAAAVLAVVGTLAFVLGAQQARRAGQPRERAGRADVAGPTPPGPGVPAILAAAGLAGYAALAHEVSFFRILSLVLGGTVYGFAITLATFLSGIASGSVVAGRLLHGAGPGAAARVGAVALGLGGLAALGAGWGAGELPWIYIRLFRAIGPSPWLEGSLAALVLFPTAAFGGAAFAALLQALPGGAEGTRAGRLYGANTIGAVMGAGLTGMLVLPALGVGGAIGTAAAVAMAGAAFVAPGRVLSVGLAGLAVVAAVASPAVRPSVLATGPFGYVADLPADLDRAGFRAQFEAGRIDLLFHRDGRSATVTVERFPHVNTIYLKTNGKVEGSVPMDPSRGSAADMTTQLSLAAAPIALHRDARRALIIGLGSGVTAGAALAFGLDRVEVCEIEPAVIEAVRQVEPLRVGAGLDLADPRLLLRAVDGRKVLEQADRGRWDVIVSQPSEPWRSGSAALFTLEAFQAMRRGLAPGGVVAQWVQLYGLDADGLRNVLSTFLSVFPEVAVLRPAGARELVLLGTEAPLAITWDGVSEKLQPVGVRRMLARGQLDSPAALLGQIVCGTEAVRSYAGDASPSTDDRNRIEFLAPRTRFAPPEQADGLVLALCREGLGLAALFPEADSGLLRTVSLGAARAGNVWAAEAHANRFEDVQERLRLVGDVRLVARDTAGALRSWGDALRHDPTDQDTLQRVVKLRLSLDAGNR